MKSVRLTIESNSEGRNRTEHFVIRFTENGPMIRSVHQAILQEDRKTVAAMAGVMLHVREESGE